ncbi:unnamed protein product [Sphenostylis stenocarpa]|uniref:Tetraspanin-3 n=1 Tax=Sphenostylis stenocarpa TaxID=92480 RepID=A0AA86VQ84_9FABA|nr:unnamed protein product [Sphenostylis stenocarpa]
MMLRGSNNLICLLNFFILVLSVPILGGGIWLSTRSNGTECLKFLQLPLIIVAVSIMVTSLAGLTGACYRNNLLMTLYLVALIFIMMVFLGFIIFAYAVTSKGSGKVTQNRAYLEYYLQDYQGWLKERVASDKYWTKLSSCVRDSKVCEKLGRNINGVPETADIFYFRNLSPIQSGCCKPPTECGYSYENETMWSPGSAVVGSNQDCGRWSNDQTLLCYECDSCKAALLATFKIRWRKVSLINIALFILLLVLYIVAYAAYRNNRRINNCEPCGQTKITKARPT